MPAPLKGDFFPSLRHPPQVSTKLAPSFRADPLISCSLEQRVPQTGIPSSFSRHLPAPYTALGASPLLPPPPLLGPCFSEEQAPSILLQNWLLARVTKPIPLRRKDLTPPVEFPLACMYLNYFKLWNISCIQKHINISVQINSNKNTGACVPIALLSYLSIVPPATEEKSVAFIVSTPMYVDLSNVLFSFA